MSIHESLRPLIVLGAAVLGACAPRNTAPPRFLPKPDSAGASVHGGWVDVRVRSDTTVETFIGEVLAVSNDSIWILSERDAGIVIARSAIVSGRITGFRTGGSTAAWWTTAGALSSIANGWFFIIMAPAWALTGAISHYGDRRDAERDLPDDFARAEVDLRAVARFPQGMPPRMEASFRRLRPPR